MIKSTFIILEGIGSGTEKRLWCRGIKSWQDFLDSSAIDGISGYRKARYDERLLEATYELQTLNAKYFKDVLDRNNHWRLFDRFRDHALYLDIETTGGSLEDGDLTVVGISNGKETKTFINGINLTSENLERELDGAKMLITFYGSVFDIPFLRHTFPRLDLNLPHFDLCFAARRLGLRGGLKRIEMETGIKRDEEVLGLNGWDAVRLWHRYIRGDNRSLDILLKYNLEDTTNLVPLAEIVYQGLRETSGIGV